MFDALSIEADPKTKLPYARLPLKFVVEWTDDRLLDSARNPCIGLMPDLVAITRGMHLTDERRETILARTASFWLPWLDIATRAQGGFRPA